jgi:hypothetical protein
LKYENLFQFVRKSKKNFNRTVKIRILFNEFNDILELYEQSSSDYADLCLKYATIPNQLKKHPSDILNHVQNQHRTLIFPFKITPYHLQEFSNDQRFILPNLPTNDKAKHSFVLRQMDFTKLSRLLVSKSFSFSIRIIIFV